MQLWLRPETERGLGKSWQSVWFKTHPFPSQWHHWSQWARLTEAISTGLKAHLGSASSDLAAGKHTVVKLFLIYFQLFLIKPAFELKHSVSRVHRRTVQTARLTGLLTFHYFLVEVADLQQVISELLVSSCVWVSVAFGPEIQHPSASQRGGGGNQLTFEGAALFISRRLNVREQSSVALRENRNQRGQRPRQINHLPFLYRIRKDSIPQTYTDSSPRKHFTAWGNLFYLQTTQSVFTSYGQLK